MVALCIGGRARPNILRRPAGMATNAGTSRQGSDNKESCHHGNHGGRCRRHLPSQPDGYHGRIENGDDAARRGNFVPRAEQRALRKGMLACTIVLVIHMWNFIDLPTCSAFSTLRRILDGLSGPGKISSVPASGPVVWKICSC